MHIISISLVIHSNPYIEPKFIQATSKCGILYHTLNVDYPYWGSASEHSEGTECLFYLPTTGDISLGGVHE